MIKIGVIIGNGTGKELADIFEQFLTAIAEKNCKKVEIVRSEQIFHSYASIKEGNAEEIKRLSKEDADILEKFVIDWSFQGISTVFRTSVNAEALYLFRQQIKAVKEFRLSYNGRNILIFRDMTEGYYANANYEIKNGNISFTGIYTQEHTQKTAKYALSIADKKLEKGYNIYAFYKAHLFGSSLEKWFAEINADISVLQPDTGFTILFQEYFRYSSKPNKDLLIICSNEIGDLIYEPIIELLNIGSEGKYGLHVRNHYLSENLKEVMTEYQTVHGSADDIAGKNKVYPYATLRIVAEIAEYVLGIPNMRKEMDIAISESEWLLNKDYTTTSILEIIRSYFLLDI